MKNSIRSKDSRLVIAAWSIACGPSGAFIVRHLESALHYGRSFADAARHAAEQASRDNADSGPMPRGISVDFEPAPRGECREVLMYESDTHRIRLWREDDLWCLCVLSDSDKPTDRIVYSAMYASQVNPLCVSSDVLTVDGRPDWPVLRTAPDHVLSGALVQRDTYDREFVCLYGEEAVRAAAELGRKLVLLKCPDEDGDPPKITLEEARSLPIGVRERLVLTLSTLKIGE